MIGSSQGQAGSYSFVTEWAATMARYEPRTIRYNELIRSNEQVMLQELLNGKAIRLSTLKLLSLVMRESCTPFD
jgi:hypothetical protein